MPRHQPLPNAIESSIRFIVQTIELNIKSDLASEAPIDIVQLAKAGETLVKIRAALLRTDVNNDRPQTLEEMMRDRQKLGKNYDADEDDEE